MQARFMLVSTHITIIVYGYDMHDLNVPLVASSLLSPVLNVNT